MVKTNTTKLVSWLRQELTNDYKRKKRELKVASLCYQRQKLRDNHIKADNVDAIMVINLSSLLFSEFS